MRFGARSTLVPGLVLIVGGLLLFTRRRWTAATRPTCCRRWSCSASAPALSFPALMALAMSGADARATPAWPRGWSTPRMQVGGALGLAVLATLASGRTGHAVAAGHSQAAALTDGYQLAFLVGAVLVAGAVAISLTVLRVPGAGAEGHATAATSEPVLAEAA